MSKLRKKLKHAFAVDPPGPTEPTEVQKRAVDFLCAAIVRRHMTVPAITILEMSRPLNFMFASAMHVAEPAAGVLTRLVRLLAAKPVGMLGLEDDGRDRLRQEDWTPIAEFFEKRGSIDYVLRKIEELEELASREKEKGEKREEKQSEAEVESNTDEPR